MQIDKAELIKSKILDMTVSLAAVRQLRITM